MIIALGDVYARIQDRHEVVELMRATQRLAGAEPGCRRYAFAELVDDPGHFLVVEEWEDRIALERHWQSKAFADYQAAIGTHLVRTSELSVHDVIASVTPVNRAAIPVAQDD